MKSSENALRSASTVLAVCGSSLSTTLLPRRNISASLLLKRNSSGRRTDWLWPDLNTRVVAMLRLFMDMVLRSRRGCALPRQYRRKESIGVVRGGAEFEEAAGGERDLVPR